MSELGERLSKLRRDKGMTQEELSVLIGMSRTHLSNLEAPGKVTSISLEKLFTIADVLDVPPAYLLSADIIPEDRLITK